MSGHLFLATNRAAFGEALVGLAVALELHRRGDRVAFLYPSPLTRIFQDAPFPRGIIDVAVFDLGRALRDTLRQRDLDTLVLVDVVSVLGTSGAGVARAMLRGLPAKVLGLDLWNLPDTDLTWDVGVYRTKVDPISLEIPSLRPCPMARPDARGGFRALPEMPEVTAESRARIRAEAGAGPSERLVVLTSGAWQQPNAYYHQIPRRLAEHYPRIVEMVTKRLAPNVRFVHVGPKAFEWGTSDARYRWVPQLAPAEFRALLVAADALLSLNVPATSLAAAIAAGTPSVVLVNSGRGDTLEEIVASANHPLADDIRAWIGDVLPLRPFRVCPVGLYSFLEPVLANNPFREAFEEVQLLDLDGAAAALTTLLEDAGARARMKVRQAAYREQIQKLPTAAERFDELRG